MNRLAKYDLFKEAVFQLFKNRQHNFSAFFDNMKVVETFTLTRRPVSV